MMTAALRSVLRALVGSRRRQVYLVMAVVPLLGACAYLAARPVRRHHRDEGQLLRPRHPVEELLLHGLVREIEDVDHGAWV